MSKQMRILRNVALGVGGILVVLGIAAILIARSDWFQNYIKRTIITSAEDATGGRAEVGTFSFDWTHLSAVMTGFAIHGSEPAGSAPLLRVARAQVNLRFFTSVHHLWDIAYLGADHPEANVVVYADGRTNIPSPRVKTASNEPPLQSIVNLAIGRFELTNGVLTFAAQKQQLDIRGNNLRAQLSYNILSQEYRGRISLQPIYVVAGRNTPVDFTVELPVVLARDRIDVQDARITSSESAVSLNASIQDLRNPKLSGRATGHIAIADLKNAADLPLSINATNVPSTIELEANASSGNNAMNITELRLSLGHSSIQASGSLASGLNFTSQLALGELGRLVNRANLPDEIVSVDGRATLDAQNTYEVRTGLKDLNLESVVRAAGGTPLPYQGVLSGPIDVRGNLNSGLRGLTAQVKLSIAAGHKGIPLAGKLTASYVGATDNISIENSVLTLPHSRLQVDGSVGKQVNVALTTTDFNDLLAAVPAKSRPAIALHGGRASFTGKVTGSLSAPRVAGQLTADHFSVAGRQFDSFSADASLKKNGAEIQNGSILRNAMQARFSGALGLRDWKPVESAPLSIDASIQNGDLADLLALGGQPSRGYSGQLNAKADISGTLGNPQGAGTLVVTNGMIDSQPFDRAEARVNLTDQLVTVPSAFIQMGGGRVNLSGVYQHPRDSFTTGQLRAEVQSDQINLAQVSSVQQQKANAAGVIQLQVKVAAKLTDQFQLTSVDGNASVRGLRWAGQNYGDLTASATTSGHSATYDVSSNFAGSKIQLNGSTQLTRDYPTSARASVGNLAIQQLLAVANRGDIPVKGVLNGSATVMGTLSDPQGSADLTLSNGQIFDDALERVRARVDYTPQRIEVPQLELASGPSRIDLTARYDHAAGTLQAGNLQFRMNTSSIDLARIKTLAEQRPGLGGSLQVNASGAAEVRATEPQILVRDFNSDIKATDVAMNGKHLGDLTLNASTSAGRVNFTLNSGLAGASIEGRGNVQLGSRYSTDAQLSFKNVSWAGLRPVLGYSAGEGRGFEASGDGQVSVSGPLLNTDQLHGSLQVTRLQVSGAASAFRPASPVLLQNQGPIAATLTSGTVKIESAHLTGPQTDFQVSGAVPRNGQGMDVALNGNVNLAILQQFDQSITSSGNIVLAASVRGTLAAPRLSGQVELRNSSFAYPNLPTGVWKANGVVILNGTSAVIRNLTAEAGGGQVNVTGSATLSDTLRFGVQAKANRVRLEVQPGVAVVASATVNLSGTTESSTASGTVTVDQISYASRSDVGSLLSMAAPPVQTPSSPSPFLENMRLDIRVRSSSAAGLRASIAQDLQLTADLRLRGSAANPGVLGRVIITEGKLLFFGSTYTVNTGSIAFYNPIRVEPILDLSLETQTQGVDVTLRVTGPIDNMKLSYTSDPPLPFQEIVSLLATGTTPTSDPTLLANQPTMPAQSFQQAGESAIVGKALADPVTNQLQRVFGVTQLKINPAFTSGSQLPEAQLTLQQQISSNISFTYVSGLNTANAQTIQAVWTFTPQWSAQALRDYNGIFSVTLMYKRQLR